MRNPNSFEFLRRRVDRRDRNPKYDNINEIFIKIGIIKIPHRFQEICVYDIGSKYICFIFSYICI